MAKLSKNIGEDPIVKPDPTNNKYLNIPGANKEKMATWLSMGKSEPESLRDAQLLAEAVGYSPEQALVVASQWAFESGGGAKLSSPYNYFGIKSHNKSVQERIKDKYGIEVGEGPQTKTAEFLGNGRKVIDDSFMTFNNAIESFLGHKAFLETNDIYSKALKATTAKQFAQELQNAGYATVKNSEGKPIYASKLADFYRPMQRNENYGKERSKYWGELKSEKLAEKLNPTPTLPKIENVPVPIERPPVDPSNFYLPETGPRAIEFVNTDAMNAMMKSKLAYANEFNNPAAQRMVAPTDQSYDFGNGETGTHFMSSMDNFAVPQIQNENGQLQLGDYGSNSNEAIRFDRNSDADYFAAENYKKVSPAFPEYQNTVINNNVKKFGGNVSEMGYRDDSPFRNAKSLDIHSPEGLIDMSQTGMPLMANGVFLQPYSGMHQVPTNNGIVTETPAVLQNGGGMNASAQVQPTIEPEPPVVPIDEKKQQKYLNTSGVNKEKLQQWFASGKEAPTSIEDAQLLAEAVGYSPNHAKVVAGQWALESAKGKSVGGNYNYFGIKSHSAATRKRLSEKYGLTVSANDPVSTREEDKSGKSSKIQSSFLNFEDPVGAFLGHKAFLETNKRYADALKTETAYDFAAKIKEAGYATSSEYIQSIGNTIKPLIDEEEFKKFNKKELHSGHLNTLQTIPKEQKSLVTRMPREMQFDVLDSLYKKETTDANEVQYEIDMATKKKNAYIDKLPVDNITPQKTPQFGQGQLFHAYGGPLGNPYQNGGNIGAGIASGAYGLAEGTLDTLTFGLTDGLTDKGYEAMFQNADKGVQGIRDVANIGGAVAGAIINPAAIGSAIGEGAEGVQGAMGKTGNETVSGIGNMIGQAGNIAGMFINPGEAATGKVASTLQQFSQNPLAQQGMGMMDEMIPQQPSAQLGYFAEYGGNILQNGGTTLPGVTVTGTKSSVNPSGTAQATPAMINNPNYAEQNKLYQQSLSNAPLASLSATADQALLDNFTANRDKMFPKQAGLNINKLVYDPTMVDPNTGLPQQFLEYFDAPAKQVQAPTPATPAAPRQASYLHPHTGQPLDPAIYGRPEDGSQDVQFSQGLELSSRKLENINARQATENEKQANIELLKTMTPEQIARVKASGQTPTQYMNANAMTYGGGFMNAFAGGGNMFQNGGFGMNSMNEIPVTEFNAGGTHAENPLGGIPQGTGPNGQPNLVEEGELKIDDPRDPSGKAKFIVSAQDDMKITKELATEHDLPKKFVGKSVRKAADLLLRKGSRRDGDSIEENSKQQDLIGFINAHEALTQAKEAEKMSAFQDQMGALAQEYPSEMQRAFGGNIHQYNPNMYVDNPAFMDYMRQSLTLPNTQGTTSNTGEGNTGEGNTGELEKYNPMQDVGNVQGQQGWGNYAMQMAPALMNIGQGLFGKKDSLNLSRMDEVKLGRINADQQLRELGYDAAQAQKRNKGLSGGGYRANAQSIFNAAQKARAGIHANVDSANTQIGNQEAGMNLQVGQINLGQEGKEQMYDKQAAAAKQALVSTGVGQLAQMAKANQANDLAADYNSMFSDRYSYSYLRPWEKKTTK